MNIAIASGKGGTGKTTLAVNLAWHLAQRGHAVGLYDCDVEAPDDNLFLGIPESSLEMRPVRQDKPVWDKARCVGCGKCAEICHYKALSRIKDLVLTFPEMCHSCGACEYVCPSGGIKMMPYEVGKLYLYAGSVPFRFCSGLLNIGETAAPAVVKDVKRLMRNGDVNLIDTAPGTACQAAEALKGSDAVILVTEPTLFGLSDLKLAAALCGKMRLPTGIVINRAGEGDNLIERFALEAGIPVIGKIPFMRQYAQHYSTGGILAEKFSEFDAQMGIIYSGAEKLSAIPVVETEPLRTAATINPEAEFPPGNYMRFTEFAVISGKGGTGKTTFTASLAVLAHGKAVFADCDVDAANLHLLLQPEILSGTMFSGGTAAVIDSGQCIGCGLCRKLCRFEAVNVNEAGIYRIDPADCEGCGLCAAACPVQAVKEKAADTGIWHISRTKYGPLVHARLNTGSENSGKLVSQVKNNASALARSLKPQALINDGPPGSGCPVIATLAGADQVIIVTEPTVSGVHDLERVLELAAYFSIASAVVVNKADLNDEMKLRIIEFAARYKADFLGEIPFDGNVNTALASGMTVIEYGHGPAYDAILNIWEKIELKLEMKGQKK